MKTKTELRALEVNDLETELLGLRKEQLNQRLRQANGALDKPHVVKLVRRAIARIKTIMTEKAGK